MERKILIEQTRIFNPGVNALDCKQCGKTFYGHKSSTHCEPCTKTPEEKEQEYRDFESWWLYHIDGPKISSEQKSFIIGKL
jgi:hypothetical protein